MSIDLKAPIILFGNVRSGTTIFQKVMSSHPEVVQWYEPNALWLYADTNRIHDVFDENDATKKVIKHIRKRFHKYQQKHGNRLILEKTPRNILRIPYVRSIFPDAKFLYIVRDPFSYISSAEVKWQRPIGLKGIVRYLNDMSVSQLPIWIHRYLKEQFRTRVLGQKYLPVWGPRYEGIQEDLKTYDLLTVIAKQWAISSKVADKDFSHFQPNQVLKFKYEEFVHNPISILEKVCKHCGLEMTEELIEAAKEIKSDRMTKWQRIDPSKLAKILPVIQDEMIRHGYEIPEEIGQLIE